MNKKKLLITLTDLQYEALSNHPSRVAYESDPSFIRHIITDWLDKYVHEDMTDTFKTLVELNRERLEQQYINWGYTQQEAKEHGKKYRQDQYQNWLNQNVRKS